MYRNLISFNTYNPNIKNKPTGPPENPLWFMVNIKDIKLGSAKPKGIAEGGDSCSPCSAMHYKNEAGVSHPLSLSQSSCNSYSHTTWPPYEDSKSLGD